MRYLPVILPLIGLLSACTDIELSKQVTILDQQGQELSHKTYGLTGNSCQTTDGGLATILLRNASNRGKDDYTSPYFLRNELVLAKTTATGQLQWAKQVWAGTGSANSRPLLYALTDGTYRVFLTTAKTASPSTIDYREPVLLRVSATGDVVSQQALEGTRLPTDFTVLGLVTVPGKGFVIKGHTAKNSLPTPYLLRFDEQGRLLWNRTYDQLAVISSAYGLAATTDGGLIMSGYSTTSGQATDGVLLRLDADGQSVWLRRYPSVRATVVRESVDKGFVLLGISPSPASLPALSSLSPDGDVRWTQPFSLPTNQYSQPIALFTSADTYVAVYSVLPAGTFDFSTTDLAGKELAHQRVFAPGTVVFGNDMLQLSNGSFAVVINNSTGVSLLKIKSDKTIEWQLVIATNT